MLQGEHLLGYLALATLGSGSYHFLFLFIFPAYRMLIDLSTGAYTCSDRAAMHEDGEDMVDSEYLK